MENNIPDYGIYLHWDRVSTSTHIKYDILRSEYFDGNYTVISSVTWPQNSYVDSTGKSSYYYKIQEIDVTDPNNPINGALSQPIIGEEVLLMETVYDQLGELLKIPIYDEECIFGRDRTSARFAFDNWNCWPKPEIRITGTVTAGGNDPYIILDENTTIKRTAGATDNYPNGLKYKLDFQGKIYFLAGDNTSVAIQNYDSVYASYNVRLFTGHEINNALNLALQTINAQPGTNKYNNLISAPLYYDPALVTGAIYFLLRGLLNRLTQRETRMLIQDPDSGSGVFDSIGAIRENAKMYKEEWDGYLKTLPKAKYPSIQSIVTPQMMLPGGRSRMFRYMWSGGANP